MEKAERFKIGNLSACPLCGSGDIELFNAEVVEGAIYRHYGCRKCRASWLCKFAIVSLELD